MGLPWTARLRRIEERAAAALPQTTDVALFRITGGKVRIKSIIGEVTTVIQNQANNTKLKFNPSGTGSDVDLCAVLDIANDAVGTHYTIVGVVATAMKGTTNLFVTLPADTIPAEGIILGPGDIELDCAASNTGAVKWTVEWEPVDGAGHLTAV
jgi:hypothetical protein